MILAKRRGPGGGHPAEVAAGLVPVAQLLGHRSKVEGDRQQQRVAVAETALPGGQGLLQHGARVRRVARLAVETGQRERGPENLGMIFPVHRADPLERVGQRRRRPGEIAGVPPLPGVELGGGQYGGVGHLRHAAWRRARTPVRRGFVGCWTAARAR
jgi:hypothetical protein